MDALLRNKVFLAGVAAVVVGLGAWALFSKSEPEQVVEDDVEEEAIQVEEKAAAPAPAAAAAVASVSSGDEEAAPGTKITRSKLLVIIKEMSDQITALMADLESKYGGKEVDERTAMQHQQEAAIALKGIEESVQQKYGFTQMDLLEAQGHFAGDEEVKEGMKNLRNLFFGGGDDEEINPDDVEVPAGMTADQFYDKFCVHIGMVEEAYVEAVKEAKRSAPKGEERHMYLQMIMYRKFETLNERVAQAIDMSEEDFQKCMFKYQGDARFLRKLLESQQRQEELRESLNDD